MTDGTDIEEFVGLSLRDDTGAQHHLRLQGRQLRFLVYQLCFYVTFFCDNKSFCDLCKECPREFFFRRSAILPIVDFSKWYEYISVGKIKSNKQR